jgi:uncharacterized membrane protein YphA (DoxX/SURF4 family)
VKNIYSIKRKKLKFSSDQKIYYSLRIAAAMCFIGHGSFGIIQKAIWCNYFGVFGLAHDLAWQLMPVVGTIDILMGIIILVYPARAVLVWLVIWGLITALLRPLSGEPFAEFIERAGNFGAPLALLLLSGGIGNNIKRMFAPVSVLGNSNPKIVSSVIMILRIVVFLLFSGHGWLNLIEKKSIVDQYQSLGFSNPGTTAQLVGVFEIIGAFMVLIRPLKSIVLVLLIWKITSELFYPHYEILEWIERGGSYGSILALWFALDANSNYGKNFRFWKLQGGMNAEKVRSNHFLSNKNQFSQ